MTLDLTRPDHREALRWACELNARDAELAACWRPIDERGWLKADALDAMQSPSNSAALVRALLEGCGVVIDLEHHRGAQWRVIYYLDGVRMWFAISYGNGDPVPGIPALILRLLACTDATGALAALKEVGR
jgi:hypothetical protein